MTAPARVLLVEDDAALSRAVEINLRARGYEVTAVATGRGALDAVAHEHPDLVVLDLGLPDLDGLEVLEGIRGWNPVPVIVLSARSTSGEKVRALDLGADDYVTKPFEMNELLARLRAAARRATPPAEAPEAVETAGFTVDLAEREVRRDGVPVRLTPTEWQVLEVLARHVDRLVPQQQLLTEVWGPGYERQGHYLRVYLSQLRRKLERDPTTPRHLLTVPGFGYRLSP